MVFSMLRRLFGTASRPSGSRPRRPAPAVESLEARLVLSGSSLLPGHPLPETDVRVMTYNLNNGSDLIPLFSVQKPQDIPGAVSQILTEVQTSDIPDRALALAKQIAQARPDLLGVQEASIWTVNGTVKYDVLGSLMTDLAKLGQHYTVAVKVNAFGGQLPDAQGEFVGLQDQNAILVRTNLPKGQFQVTNPQSGFFQNNFALPLPGLPAPVPAQDSWASVDVSYRGHQFRFVTTHLDSDSPAVNDAQAKELAADLAKSPLPVILAGDFNAQAAGAGSQTYTDLINAGFQDAWTQAHAKSPGYTWGLSDPASPSIQLNQRIDLVLYLGKFETDNATLFGNHKADQTASGLYPSDHAGVKAILDLP